MKYFLCYIVTFCLCSAVRGQGAGNDLNVIYIDNYQSASDPGLTEIADDSIHALIKKIKTEKSGIFMMQSDGTDPNETQNPGTMEAIYDSINNHTHAGNPADELFDSKELRNAIAEMSARAHPANIHLYYFVSSDVLDPACNSSSLLVNFLPREISMISPGSAITVDLFYCGKKNSNINDKLKKSFGFYNAEGFKSNIKFRTIPL